MSFITQFKIEFLPPFTSCRKVFQKMPDLLLMLLGDLFNGNTSFIVSGEMSLNTLCNSVVPGTANFYNELYTFYTSSKNLRMKVVFTQPRYFIIPFMIIEHRHQRTMFQLSFKFIHYRFPFNFHKRRYLRQCTKF